MGAYFELTNYKPENIQIIGFLDLETKKYIFFDFLPGKYSQVPNPSSYGPKYLLRFKNEPKFKSDNLKLQEVDKLSKLSKEDRLEYIDRQIKDYEIKINFLRKRREKENGENITEQIDDITSKINFLHNIKKSI